MRLTKRDGGRTAVENLSFTAAEDEIVGLHGPNGDAKTSTIPLLITVLAPTRGQFSVVGHHAVPLLLGLIAAGVLFQIRCRGSGR